MNRNQAYFLLTVLAILATLFAFGFDAPAARGQALLGLGMCAIGAIVVATCAPRDLSPPDPETTERA